MLRQCRVRLARPNGRRNSVGSSGTWNTDFLAAIGASASNAALRHTVLRTPRRDLDEVVYLTSSNTVAQEHIGRVLGVNYGLLRQSKHWAQASPTNVLRLIDMFVQHRIPVDVHVQQAMATALTPMLPLITSLELVALLERLFALKLLLAPPILVSTVQALRDSMDMWFPSGADDAVILQTGATAMLHMLQSVAACAPNQSTSDIAAYGLLLRDASYISARAAARLSLTAEGLATNSMGKEDTLVEIYVTMVEVCALGRRVALTARRQCGYVVDAAAADLLDECDKLLAMGQASVTASLLHVVNPRGWHTRAAKDATVVSGWTMPATSVARVANSVCSMPESHRTFAVSAISHHMAHLINFPHGFGGTGLKKAHPQVLTLTDCLSLLVSMRSAELAAASVAPTVSLNAEGLARVGGRTTAMTYNGLLATTARLARRPTEGSQEEAHAELFPSVAIEGLRALCAVTRTSEGLTPLAHIHWTGRTADVAVLLQERLIAIVAEIDVRATLMLLETIALQPTAAQCVSAGITSEVVERWWTSRRRLTDAALAAAYVHLGDPTSRLSAVDVCAVAALAKRVERIDTSAGPNTESVVGAAKVRFALARKDAIASSIPLSSAYFAEPILRRLLSFATGTNVPYAALNQTFEEPQPAAVLHTARAAAVETEKEASGVTAVMPFDAFLLK
jgi:hypothetical protein